MAGRPRSAFAVDERTCGPPPLDQTDPLVAGDGPIRAGGDSAGRRTRVYALRLRAWQRWQAAAGAWCGWATCPAMVTPGPDFAATRSTDGACARVLADQVARSISDGRGTAIVIDLEPTLGVHIAAHLNSLRLANAVIIMPRWPYAD